MGFWTGLAAGLAADALKKKYEWSLLVCQTRDLPKVSAEYPASAVILLPLVTPADSAAKMPVVSQMQVMPVDATAVQLGQAAKALLKRLAEHQIKPKPDAPVFWLQVFGDSISDKQFAKYSTMVEVEKSSRPGCWDLHRLLSEKGTPVRAAEEHLNSRIRNGCSGEDLGLELLSLLQRHPERLYYDIEQMSVADILTHEPRLFIHLVGAQLQFVPTLGSNILSAAAEVYDHPLPVTEVGAVVQRLGYELINKRLRFRRDYKKYWLALKASKSWKQFNETALVLQVEYRDDGYAISRYKDIAKQGFAHEDGDGKPHRLLPLTAVPADIGDAVLAQLALIQAGRREKE